MPSRKKVALLIETSNSYALELPPLDAADSLAGAATTTSRLVAALRANQSFLQNRELHLTLGDYEAMAQLGLYCAEKIRGACDLALCDASRRPEQEASAIAHPEHALAVWKSYAAVRGAQYVPGFYSRIGQIDITVLAGAAAKDIDLARAWKPGTLKYDPTTQPKS